MIFALEPNGCAFELMLMLERMGLQIFIFSVDGLRGDLSLSDVNLIADLRSGTANARLGWIVKFADVNADNVDVRRSHHCGRGCQLVSTCC